MAGIDRQSTLRFLSEPADVNFGGKVHGGAVMKWIAKVIYTGKTSMHIGIDVRAGDPKVSERHLTTHCIVIMVAVDEHGQPTPVPEWIPQTEHDIHLRDSALRLMEMRKKIGAEMEAHVVK